MIINVDENMPTSDLLDVKVGTQIMNKNELTGYVKEIDIRDTDELLLFIFSLDNGKQIEIRKIKNIC